MMKIDSSILLLFALLILFSCNKETGKNEYLLTFNFNSGELLQRSCIIFEKQKKYESGYGHLENLKNNKNGVIIQSVPKATYFKLACLKTEAHYLACNLNLNHWFYVNGKQIKGPLEMYGKYEKKGKTFIVNEGTFSVYWENAADYGEQPQLLTGTWTLKKQ